MTDTARRCPPALQDGALFRVGPPLTRFLLRVDVAAAQASAGEQLPLAALPCRSVLLGDWAALWLGPDEQLIIGPETMSDAFFRRASGALQGLPHSLVDVSHRQIGLEVGGPHAAELLNAGCPLDLDLVQFPVSACTRTVLAKTEIVLWRRANEQFHIEVWRSFAPYLTGFLSAAEKEFVDA